MSRHRMDRRGGFTLIELAIGVAIASTVAAMSVPVVSRMHVSGNETTAQAALSAYRTGMLNYQIFTGRFPTALTQLGDGVPPYVDAKLAAGLRQGYTFVLSDRTDATYAITATPEVPTVTGNRIFTLTEGGDILESQLSRGGQPAPQTPAAIARDRVDQLRRALEHYKRRTGGGYPSELTDLTAADWDGDPQELRRIQRARSSANAADGYAYFYTTHHRGHREYTLQAHPQLVRGRDGYRYPDGATTVYVLDSVRGLRESRVAQPRPRRS